MSTDTRSRMVDGAVRRLATAGLQGASIAEVLEVSGAPRGSVYHHFPGGKDQLVTEALAVSRDRTLRLLAQHEGGSAVEVVTAFVEPWRELLVGAGFRAGCGAAAVAIAAPDSTLRSASADVFAAWCDSLRVLLVSAGIDAGRAASFSTLVVASIEGAVILSRAAQDAAPFESVAAQLVEQASVLDRSAGERRE